MYKGRRLEAVERRVEEHAREELKFIQKDGAAMGFLKRMDMPDTHKEGLGHLDRVNGKRFKYALAGATGEAGSFRG